ncbi:hypothetical protein [Azospirillum sp.]|uniref:hypothetical protein n=1 Tax=Azospirillum sp. TaxID=34012 RepID=UPI003D702FE5
MPYTSYTPFAEPAADRRHRRPLQAVPGHPDIPVYGRRDGSAHAAGRECVMGRVLRMDATGLWVVRLGGELAEIAGRTYWETLGDLQAAAKRAGLPLSDLTIHTGRNA